MLFAALAILGGCSGKKTTGKGQAADADTVAVPDTGYTGIKQYFSNERMLKEVTFRNGVRDGLMKTYYPGGQLYWFTVPNDAEGVYVLTRHIDFGGIFRGRRQIILDQYTGRILHVADPLTGKGGNVFLQWQWPLHSGQALRMGGRILVFITGLACTVLFITGIIRWLQKRRVKQHRTKL